MRPMRRSLLSVPANQERFYSRALEGAADTLTYDLEDSVAPGGKEAARALLEAHYPRDYAGPKELTIRVNHPATPWFAADMELVARLRPHGLVVPKVEDAATVQALSAAFAGPLLLYIETLAGCEELRAICAAAPAGSALLIGIEDLTAELGVERASVHVQPLLGRVVLDCVLAAKRRGLTVIGPVGRGYGAPENLAELEAESRWLRSVGVAGRVAIHPSQIPVFNQVFGLTEAEIAAAKAVVAHFAAAAAQGSGVISRGQHMEDLPSLRRAEALLAAAAALGLLED